MDDLWRQQDSSMFVLQSIQQKTHLPFTLSTSFFPIPRAEATQAGDSTGSKCRSHTIIRSAVSCYRYICSSTYSTHSRYLLLALKQFKMLGTSTAAHTKCFSGEMVETQSLPSVNSNILNTHHTRIPPQKLPKRRVI